MGGENEHSGLREEDRDTAHLVARFQGGDRGAFAAIYERYFDRVYAYLRATFRNPHEAEDTTQQVFTEIYEALPRYERRSQPFRAWLFVVVRNQAVSRLRKASRSEPAEPSEIERRLDAPATNEDHVFDWITDRELILFVERLPLAQRQVLLLRYVFDLSNKQIAEILGRDAMDVGRLHYNALGFLRQRLGAARRRSAGRSTRRAESRRPLTHVQVLRARRFALTWRA